MDTLSDLKKNYPALRELHLTDKHDADSLAEFLRALQTNHVVTHVSLSGISGWNHSHAILLQTCLEQHPMLINLHIEALPLHPGDMEAIARGLGSRSCELTALSIVRQHMTVSDIYALTHIGIATNRRLDHMTILDCGLPPVGIRYIATAIPSSSLQRLQISRTGFGFKDEITVDWHMLLSAGQVIGSGLDSLVLSDQEIDSNECASIASALANCRTLKVLDLSFNPLCDSGVVALANALRLNTALERLVLSEIATLTDKGVQSLTKTFSPKARARGSRLRYIHLQKSPHVSAGAWAELRNATSVSGVTIISHLDDRADSDASTKSLEELIKESEGVREIIKEHMKQPDVPDYLRNILEPMIKEADDPPDIDSPPAGQHYPQSPQSEYNRWMTPPVWTAAMETQPPPAHLHEELQEILSDDSQDVQVIMPKRRRIDEPIIVDLEETQAPSPESTPVLFESQELLSSSSGHGSHSTVSSSGPHFNERRMQRADPKSTAIYLNPAEFYRANPELLTTDPATPGARQQVKNLLQYAHSAAFIRDVLRFREHVRKAAALKVQMNRDGDTALPSQYEPPEPDASITQFYHEHPNLFQGYGIEKIYIQAKLSARGNEYIEKVLEYRLKILDALKNAPTRELNDEILSYLRQTPHENQSAFDFFTAHEEFLAKTPVSDIRALLYGHEIDFVEGVLKQRRNYLERKRYQKEKEDFARWRSNSQRGVVIHSQEVTDSRLVESQLDMISQGIDDIPYEDEGQDVYMDTD